MTPDFVIFKAVKKMKSKFFFTKKKRIFFLPQQNFADTN